MTKNLLSKIIIAIFFTCFSGVSFADNAPLTLSLDDAILLSLRNNNAVESTRLNYVMSKLNLKVAKWQFQPHFSIEAGASYGTSVLDDEKQDPSKSITINPGMELTTPIGTKISVSGSDQQYTGPHPGITFSVVQPLMRGFGRPIVEQALEDAKDNEYIGRLNVAATLQNTVTTVINSYLDVVTAERRLIIDEDAIKRAQTSVEQTKKFIKAGHKAGNELITVQANVATAQSNLANDRNTLDQSRYQLLTAIGLDPNTNVTFTSLDLDKLSSHYPFPTLEETKAQVLKNDIQYQTDQILLHGSKQRAVAAAVDNTRWDLSLAANASTNDAALVQNSSLQQTPGFGSLFSGLNSSNSVSLRLKIPIDDEAAQVNLVGARIALKQAAMALQKEKWDKETGAINGWNLVESAKRSLEFAIAAADLQKKTYDISYQKYLHGLVDSLELQSAQSSLIQSQQALLNARIAYIKALVNLDALMGKTLTTWNIPVRLP